MWKRDVARKERLMGIYVSHRSRVTSGGNRTKVTVSLDDGEQIGPWIGPKIERPSGNCGELPYLLGADENLR